MDQIKIGKFIAERRKTINITQLQLSEKLGITDKAISKWERGIAMPDTAIMLELCDILGITVNELLTGEKNNMENNETNNEKLLLDMARALEKKNKIIWNAMWTIMTVSIIGLIGGLVIIGFFMEEGPWMLVAILSLCVVFMLPCFYALKLEVSVGAYKCKHCGYEIVPTYKQALNSMHKGTTRYLKCPKCHKRSWCKKVLKK